MLKYSKQRESIKNFLVTRYDHPTAETVYLNIRKEFPNISLGTVYRNLNLLAEIGEIQKLSPGIGPFRRESCPSLSFHLPSLRLCDGSYGEWLRSYQHSCRSGL